MVQARLGLRAVPEPPDAADAAALAVIDGPGELIGQHVTVQNAYLPEENARIIAQVIDQLKEEGTWTGEWWKYGGGGTVWDSMAYDPQLDLLYIGVGNGSPWNHRIRSNGEGDNLYLSSIVALRPSTGEYVWHYQTTPGDVWDFDATQHLLLADLPINGSTRQVLMQALGKLPRAEELDIVLEKNLPVAAGLGGGALSHQEVMEVGARVRELASFATGIGPAINFSWNAVAGAIRYVLIARVNDGAPSVLTTTSETSANIVMGPGRGEWWVAAERVGDGGRPGGEGVGVGAVASHPDSRVVRTPSFRSPAPSSSSTRSAMSRAASSIAESTRPIGPRRPPRSPTSRARSAAARRPRTPAAPSASSPPA